MFSWRFVPGLYHTKMLQSPTNRFGSKTHWLPDLSSPVASWIRFPGRFKVVPSLDFCRQICSSKAAIVCWYKATCRFFCAVFVSASASSRKLPAPVFTVPRQDKIHINIAKKYHIHHAVKSIETWRYQHLTMNDAQTQISQCKHIACSVTAIAILDEVCSIRTGLVDSQSLSTRIQWWLMMFNGSLMMFNG